MSQDAVVEEHDTVTMIYDSLLTNCHSSTIHETFDELYLRGKKTIAVFLWLCNKNIVCTLQYYYTHGRQDDFLGGGCGFV